MLDHLQREAFYGVAATQSVGSSPLEASLQFERDQQAGKFPPASRFFFIPGYAPPNGGPDEVLREATNALHAINEVSTAEEARASVRKMAGLGFKAVKIWVDDRRGTYPKMTPEVYNAIIDEAHKHGMLVHAHATTLADQKAVVRAGADVLVHLVQGEKLDDEYLALLKEKNPYWATVISLGDATAVCEHDPFFEQAMPASVIAKIRATKERRPLAPSCGPPAPNAATREAIIEYNFPRMIAAGARVVLGTDTGIEPGHTFGSGEHVEMARWVQLGLTPSQAITAATQRPAELLGLTDMGTLAEGKRADFIVLDANPLDDIHNTRRISSVYLDGRKFDREAHARALEEGGRGAVMRFPLLTILAAWSLTAASAPEASRWEQQAQNVTIIRDDWGIAHVYGKTDADAVFGMIYAQAEDDFNRVETNYINAMGRLAEAGGRVEDLPGSAHEAVHRSGGVEEAVRGKPGVAAEADERLRRRTELLPLRSIPR